MNMQIVRAGAGSGKTYHIQETLKDWVADGTVRPERILAVTFTEAAAAELKGRVRTALLSDGRLDEAAAIERAYVSTIHALGRRLLTEHAFAAGLSPSLRMIEDAEAELLLRRAVAETEALDPMTRDLAAFGYAWDYTKGSATDQFRADLRAAISKLNELGTRGDDPELPRKAVAGLERDWPEVAADGAPLDTALRRTVEALLTEFPDGIVDCATSEAARKAFTTDAAALKRGRSDDAYADWTWWDSLRKLRQSKRGCPTPDGYDALAQAVTDAADALPRHPGPRTQAAERLRMMLTGAQDVRRRYAHAKDRLGVVDFGDMIARAEALLREHPEAVRSMMDGVDCVIVDEFQDTNPVQFALLSHLIAKAPRVILVGDGKQAIMGFQGSDARLGEALTQSRPEAAETLDRNWRSVPGIMSFVNDLGAGLFESYGPLSPTRDAGCGQPPIEVLRIPTNRAPRAKGFHHVAERIRLILAEDRQVIDRTTKTSRPVQPDDIAVLCRTHAKATEYAAHLTQLGIPVDLDEKGWSAAPAVVVGRAALAIAADPTDRFNALIYLCYGPARMTLEDALTATLDGHLDAHLGLAPLIDLNARIADWPVSRVLAELRRAAGLDDWIRTLPDPARAHADLSRLDAEAAAFEGADPVTRAASGIHGWDARSFLAWLSLRIEAGEDKRPNPEGGSAKGVRLLTWHAAKGLEWPVVVATGLDWTVEERPNTLRLEFDGWDDPHTLLDRAVLHYHPETSAYEVAGHFAKARRGAAAVTERCLAYVAFTRARDLLVIEWPDYAKADADIVANLLRGEAELSIATDRLVVAGTEHPAKVRACSEHVPDSFSEDHDAPDPGVHLRPGRPETPGPRGAPLFRRPSDGGVAPALWSMRAEELGSALAYDGTVFEDSAERGTALHLALRVLVQAPGRARDLARATGLSEDALAALSGQAASLKTLLDAEGLTELHSELPFDATLADGTRIRGTADLIARSQDGTRAALIDFKSPAPQDPIDVARPYLSQLSAYAEAAATVWPGIRITRAGIHFIGAGKLVWGAPGP